MPAEESARQVCTLSHIWVQHWPMGDCEAGECVFSASSSFSLPRNRHDIRPCLHSFFLVCKLLYFCGLDVLLHCAVLGVCAAVEKAARFSSAPWKAHQDGLLEGHIVLAKMGISWQLACDHLNGCTLLFLFLRCLSHFLVFLGLCHLLFSTVSNIPHLEPLALRIRVSSALSSILKFV